MILVVSDTSAVRCLVYLRKLELLGYMFSKVYVPPAVVLELERVGSWAPAKPFLTQQSPSASGRQLSMCDDLDPGETEAIQLAMELQASYLIIDESRGREVAARLKIPTMGVLGVLLRAKDAGHVDQIMPLIDQLRHGLGFYISDALYVRVRQLAGE